MADVLIRDLPDDVVAAMDARAARLGLSRNEYLRRVLGQLARRGESAVNADDVRCFADTFSDLSDPDVMGNAWRQSDRTNQARL